MASQTSRLVRNQEKQSKRQIVISLIGIVIILVILMQFGPFFIGETGNLISSLQGKGNDENSIKSADYVEPPVLNDIPKATSTQEVTVSGKSQYTDATVEVYVNNTSYKDIEIKDGVFTLDKIQLSPGSNSIKARVKKGEKTSDFSNEFFVSYTKDAPKLEISSPQDGSTFTKADREINVTGKTDTDNTVVVNGFRAIVDGDGIFSYYLRLNDGDNSLKIEAQNPAGQKTTTEIKVIYKPE